MVKYLDTEKKEIETTMLSKYILIHFNPVDIIQNYRTLAFRYLFTHEKKIIVIRRNT